MRYSLVRVRPMFWCYPVRAVPLAAVIPSGIPAVAGRHGAVRVRAGGQAGPVKFAPAPPGEGGGADKSAASRLAAGREGWSCGWLGGGEGWLPGQGADLAVAQAVEHQGEQLAGGGDLGRPRP